MKPWPSLDGLSINPVVLPIIGGQIVLLTVGLLTSMCDSDEEAVTRSGCLHERRSYSLSQHTL